MRIRYHTGTATLVQFIIMSMLSAANATTAGIATCRVQGSECANNTVATFVLFLFTVVFFAAVWILGYSAQERRSHRLSHLLILVEISILVIATFNARHPTNTLSVITSLIDICLAIWVIVLALRLSRAKGGRIMASPRKRKRTITTEKL